ncbi:hypothetical protein [Mycobacterium sp. Aquia_213]|uniref:hypothetical protein n=1 Tax=Mycobacterium sp. Aquia_213 TaxID=2991728 RepID=UPI0022718920|nr:hypothetical protein [Mycobacterium sp. Aquia_213]WAC89710.1 hypothetical protein LMQ14_17330 [Mycobacterium sp. Aquia_213]
MRRRTNPPDPNRTPKPKPKPEPVAEQQITPGQPLKRMGPPGSPKPKTPAGPITPDILSKSEYMSIEWPPVAPGAPSIQFSMKITKRTVNRTRKTIEIESIPLEDTIHPRTLPFDPPLQQYGKGDAKGFRHNWEKLDYVFGLPDPYAFPQIQVQQEDREGIERYIKMCRRLATFSVINDETKLSAAAPTGPDSWRVQVVDYPSDESFMGTSAAFRQLHNDGETASFTNAHNALFKAMKALPEKHQSTIKYVVPQWRAARGKLMNQMLQTLTALKAGNATLDNPVSYGNVNPDELIRTFNYGDSLHFGDSRGQLDDLLADPFHEAYYKYAALLSIVGLSHLYFGFAVLLDRALGGVA